MAQIKYRVHEVGTDFGVKYAYILELLEKYFGKSKNNRMMALTDEELNLIFEHFTQKPSKATLADYFNTYNEELRRQKAEQRRLAAEKKAAEERAAAEPAPKPEVPAEPAEKQKSGKNSKRGS